MSFLWAVASLEGSDCATLGNGNPIGPLQFDRLEVAPGRPTRIARRLPENLNRTDVDFIFGPALRCGVGCLLSPCGRLPAPVRAVSSSRMGPSARECR